MIPKTDPCKAYQLKIKLSDDEQTLPVFGNYKSNLANINVPVSMKSDKDYYEKNFKPKVSKAGDNEIKISWEDFCIPTTVDIWDNEDNEVCSKASSECILSVNPYVKKWYLQFVDVFFSSLI